MRSRSRLCLRKTLQDAGKLTLLQCINGQEDDEVEGECWRRQPFQLRRRVDRTSGDLRVRVQLHLSRDADADKREVTLEAVFRLGPPPDSAVPGKRAAKRLKLTSELQTRDFSFEMQHVQY